MDKIYRAVFTSIWNDERFPFCSDECQDVWFHIYTSDYSTPIGFVLQSVEGLAANKNKNGKWPISRYRKGFGEALQEGFIEADLKHQIIWFPKYFDWNKPQSPNVVKSWAGWFNKIPNCEIKDKATQRLKALCKALGEAFSIAFEEAFAEALAKTYPNRIETETEPEPELKDIPATPQKIAQPEGEAKQILNGWIEKARATHRRIFGKDIEPKKICLLAYGRNGSRKDCFGEIDVLIKFWETECAGKNIEDSFTWSLACAQNPETVNRLVKAI